MRTLLFGVISGPDFQAAAELAAKTHALIDGVELRLDCFTHFDKIELNDFLQSCKLPVMLTLRRADQGGKYQGTEAERLALLESFCDFKPAYIDLEYDVPLDFRKRLFETYPQILFLSSYHDFSGMPKDLAEIYDALKTPYAHIYKLAVTAQSSIDALKMLTFVKTRSAVEKIIGICMGEEGSTSRILSPLVGNYLTYASLGSASAPGQLSAQELQETYHFRRLYPNNLKNWEFDKEAPQNFCSDLVTIAERQGTSENGNSEGKLTQSKTDSLSCLGINPKTSLYALIGNPIDKSLGHLIHNAVFGQLKIDAVYVKMNVKTEDLVDLFHFVHELGLKGLSVTMPHKEAVIPFLNQSSTEVQKIGSCNTIAILEQHLMGYNTDGVGALNAIEQKESVFGKHVVIIGAGGAAKALIFEAMQRGAFVTIINRTADKAKELAQSFGAQGGGWELFPALCEKGYDVIINCIPDGQLIEEQWILPHTIAMDIVYVLKNTPFLMKASQKECRIVFGYEMFINQAVEQQRIWFPSHFDFDKVYAIVKEKVVASLHT